MAEGVEERHPIEQDAVRLTSATMTKPGRSEASLAAMPGSL